MSNKTRYIINIILSAIGIAIVLFYGYCGGACTYLQGGIFGIDLKYAGIFSMVVFVILIILKWNFGITLLASVAFGIEIYLIGFQIAYQTFCPFCLAFGLIVICQFILNFDWSKKWYMISCVLAGILIFLLFFKGSVMPTYDLSSSYIAISVC